MARKETRIRPFPVVHGKTPDLATTVSGHRILGETADDEIASTINELPVYCGAKFPAGLQILYLAEITTFIPNALHTCFYTLSRLPRRM